MSFLGFNCLKPAFAESHLFERPNPEISIKTSMPTLMTFRCSSLVTISAGDKWTTISDKDPTPVLRLAHASVADYLTQPNHTGPAHFHFSRMSARQFLAQTCLGYLMNPLFADGFDSKMHITYLETYPFLNHCVDRWPEYLKKDPGDPDDYLDTKTKETVQSFFATSSLPNGGNFAFWVGCLIPDTPLTYVLNTRPLYYAASFGLLELVHLILQTEQANDFDIDALGGRARSSALHVAVYRNHPDVVKVLLERGADPNLPNERGESPMRWAMMNHGMARNGEIKELLLKHGATLWSPHVRVLRPQQRLDEVLAERLFLALEAGDQETETRM